MNILITGNPGIGKTTLIKDVFQAIGKRAAGFYTEEIRQKGRRVGFRVKTLNGKTGVLSGVGLDSPYRVGKYRVNLGEFEKVALPAIEKALCAPKVIIIDEIGPMELFSGKFKDILLKALDSHNHVIATIKLKGSGFIEEIKSRSDVETLELGLNNKNEILKIILEKIGIKAPPYERKGKK